MRMIDDYQIDNEKYINNVAIDHDHPYVVALSYTTNLAEYATEIVSYIAEFIVRRLTKNIMCEPCINALTDNTKSAKFIQIKDRGSLIYPSASVVKICLETEKVIRFIMKEKHDITLNSKYTVHNITQIVLLNLHRENIFVDLINHCNDQSFLTYHRTHLMKSIIIKYINTRYFYIVKQTVVTQRHVFNKLILFRGQ